MVSTTGILSCPLESSAGSVMQENLRFASSGDDIKIWDASSMTLVDKFNPHTSHGISSLCWSSNNNFLVTASSSGDKIVVSNCKCKPVPLLELAEGQKQTCVDLNSTSMYLASGGLNNTVNIWDLKSKRVHQSLKDHKSEVTSVVYNWNDCYVASGSLSGEIILYSVTTNISSTPFGYGSNQPVRHMKYSLFRKSLLGSVSDNGVVTLWDVNHHSSYHSFDTHKAPASGICFSPVNELLFVTIGLDKRIILYDTSSKMVVKTLVADTPLTAVDFMPDGATLAIGSSRGKIYQYDLRMLKSPVSTISAHKTSVQCIAFQYSTSLTKASLSKGCSSKATAVSKRSIAVNSGGAAQSSGTVREAPGPSIATVLPQPVTAVAQGALAAQDKAGLPRSINTDILSKETDGGKSQDFSSFDDTRKSSLGDMFSPVRDDVAVNKGGDESVGKGEGLDLLPQLSTVFPQRKNPVTSGTLVLHSSPLNIFMDSPGKEENESHDLTAEAKKSYLGKQEPKDPLKQFTKLMISGAEPGILNTSPSSNQTRNLEKYEKPEKETEAQLIHEPSVSGSSAATPKVAASSITAGVASSLSEKIVDTLRNSQPNAPTSVQMRFIQNMIQEALDDFRDACHKDIVNLQVEMIKQFHIQLNEMHSLLERFSVSEGLVAEIERLREENKRLRTHF